MPEMRASGPSSLAAVIVIVAAAVTVVACVPQPAGERGPSTAATGPASTAGASNVGAGDTAAASPAVPSGPTPVPSFVRPTPLPAPTFLAYTVKGGDTLTSIAREYRTTPRSIAFWSREEHPSLNPESSSYQPDRLTIGWVLLLVPDAVFDEDELMDATPSPTASASPSSGGSPTPAPN